MNEARSSSSRDSFRCFLCKRDARYWRVPGGTKGDAVAQSRRKREAQRGVAQTEEDGWIVRKSFLVLTKTRWVPRPAAGPRALPVEGRLSGRSKRIQQHRAHRMY